MFRTQNLNLLKAPLRRHENSLSQLARLIMFGDIRSTWVDSLFESAIGFSFFLLSDVLCSRKKFLNLTKKQQHSTRAPLACNNLIKKLTKKIFHLKQFEIKFPKPFFPVPFEIRCEKRSSTVFLTPLSFLLFIRLYRKSTKREPHSLGASRLRDEFEDKDIVRERHQLPAYFERAARRHRPVSVHRRQSRGESN